MGLSQMNKPVYRPATLKKSAMLFIMAAAFLLLCTTASFAAGKMVIKPRIDTSYQLDSNYWKDDDNERSVSTYSVKPGIEMGYTTPKTEILFDYTLDANWYHDEDSVPAGEIDADEDDYVGHRGMFTAESRITDRLSLGLDESYTKTRDPAASDVNANDITRYKYWLNRFTPKMIYRFGEKFGAGLKYTNLITDYDKDFKEDSDENRGTFDLFYNLNSRTSFDLNYQLWDRDYEDVTVDYASNQVMFNVTRSGKFFSLTAGAGYHEREFDDDIVDDFDMFTWQLSLSGQNPPDADGVPRSSMLVSLSENFNDAGTGNTYYTATRVSLKLTRLFMERLNTFFDGYYQESDYETESRNDDTWFLSAGVDYFINDFFTIGLEGGFETRDSDVADKDYDNEYIMFHGEFHYDLGSK